LDKELKLMTISWLPPTLQINILHRFIPNLCEICYFIGLYCLHTNDMHYLNTKSHVQNFWA
jgi:hypothetical protein